MSRRVGTLSRFKMVPRRSLQLSREKLVSIGHLATGRPPVVIQPQVEDLNLLKWAATQRDFIEDQMTKHAALLFRGFSPLSVDGFQEFLRQTCGEPLGYEERSSPRSQVEGRIYTSTDHPASQSIFLHNEQSYNLKFPLRISFYCMLAAEEGGATPIADCRKVFERLEPALRQRFIDRDYMYVRNFGEGLGLSWQEAFQTEDRTVVEEYCRRNDIEVEWRSRGRLRTRQVRSAAARHPHTEEATWCNHITFFHVSTLESPTRETVLAEFAEEDLPNNTYYGDGSPIEPEVLEELRRTYRAETVTFPWQEGDILLLDNMLMAHGREPFEGDRKVVVAMAKPFAWEDLADV